MNKYFVLISIIFLLWGCKDEPGLVISGSMSGKIQLYGDDQQPWEDNSGVRVSLEGTSYVTLSTSNGSWTLSGVPPGIYNVVFSKPGFLTGKRLNFQFVGNGTYYFGSSNMGQISGVTITSLIFSKVGTSTNIGFYGTLSSADSLQRNIGVFFDTKPIEISPTMTFLSFQEIAIPPDSIAFRFDYFMTEYIKSGYHLSTGMKIYTRAMVFPRSGFYPNINPATGTEELYSDGLVFTKLDSITVL